MSLTAEEKELKKITDEFGKAMKAFQAKDHKKALEMFTALVETYKDSEYDSVLEIQTRAQIYRTLSHSHLHPARIQLKSDDDYIGEALYQLNAGNHARALELCSHLETKANVKDPYLFFLTALCHHKAGDEDAALKYLKKCIENDPVYKTIAHNEPDFEPLLENDAFISLME